MTTVSHLFRERWRSSDRQVGPAAPVMKVEVRKGRYYRGYHPWTFPEGKYSKIDYGFMPTSPNNQTGRPWQATWTPQTEYNQIHGISQVTMQKDTTQNNGIGQAQITVENVEFLAQTAEAGTFHTWDRGYLSPWRGYKAPGRSPTAQQNQWYQRLYKDAQIRVWMGYGTDTWVPVFTGLIDDCNANTGPEEGTTGGDQIIITARDFGRILADSTLYGWNIDPALFDPIVFADRGWCRSNPKDIGNWWIQVDDIADIVRIILRWAGFKHWQVEDTGQGLNPGQPLSFNRSNYYIDVINQICQLTGFIFFIGDPEPADQDPESIGIPVFRYPRWQYPQKHTLMVHDAHVLTDAQATSADADRAYIIRVRGKIPQITDPEGLPIAITNPTQLNKTVQKAEQVQTDSGDFTVRPTYVYRPPWTRADDEAGILKHVVHTDDYLVTIGDCRTACFLIAAAEALAAYTGQWQCVGTPELGLDDQVGVYDEGTGLNSRVYVTDVQQYFVQGIDQDGLDTPFWYTTFNGSMLDLPDMVAILNELKTANLNFLPYLKNPQSQG